MTETPPDDGRARLERIFDAHERHVRAYAARRLRHPHDIEDIVAETFAIAWRRLEDLPHDPLPWLYGTARRVIANHNRAERRRRALADASAGEQSRGPHESSDPGIIEALARLGESDREALLLVAWEGLTHREAAQAAGCSLAAFAARHRRARGRLARVLWESPEPTPAVLDAPQEEAR